ncbi:MAG TPA: DUF2231 domain-containing protein [Ignavibacteriaceae bacterium]|nr:DUF2231 domain-containing protein [Ignavibacteriaceae bacterium]
MEFLAGLHPKIIHFPIAFLYIYVLLEAAGIFSGKTFLQKSAYLFLLLGVLAAVAAVISGNQAADIAARWKDKGALIPIDLISEHENYATITLWYFSGLLVLRTYFVIKKKFKGAIQYLFILLALTGAYFIYQTGEYGGRLVYDHGIGTELKREEIK